MTLDLRIGDRVKASDNERIMEVVSIRGAGHNDLAVLCSWSDGSSHHSEKFRASRLHKVRLT
jgi:hypothetical protein